MTETREPSKKRNRRVLKRNLEALADTLVDSNTVTDFSEASLKATLQAMRDAASATNRINDRVGPFYSSKRVEKLLGATRQAVSERARRNRLLRVTTADGVKVFPAFQFTNDSVRYNLIPLLEELLSAADPWTVAYWLTAPQPGLKDRTALELIDTSEDNRMRLHAAARADVESWRAGAA